MIVALFFLLFGSNRTEEPKSNQMNSCSKLGNNFLSTFFILFHFYWACYFVVNNVDAHFQNIHTEIMYDVCVRVP